MIYSRCGWCPAHEIDAPGRKNHLKIYLKVSLFDNGLRIFAVGDGRSRLGISRHSSGPMNGSTTQGPSGAPLSAWRQTPHDRKRTPDDPVKVGPSKPASSTADHSLSSTWKQTALAKKLLKYASPAAATGADQDRNFVGSRAKEDEGDAAMEAKFGVQRPEVRVDSTGSLSVDDLDEDRLLPIKQNPILLSDQEKRRGAKPNHAKAEKRSKKSGHSPTPSSKTYGSEDQGTLSASTNQKPHVDDTVEDEVFDKDLTYGKGFVHKLLQKFINLSGKEETVSTFGSSKTQGHSRSSGDSCGGGKTASSSSQHSNCDGENHTSGSLGYGVCDSSVQNDKIAGISIGKIQNEKGSKVDREQSANQSLIDMEEFPQNIVLSTRDIFENSSTTTRKKQPSAVEKLRPEVAVVQTASKKRLAPGVPSTNKPAPLPTAEILRNSENLNHAGASKETSSVAAVNAKSEPQEKPLQDFPISRILHSGSRTKKTQPQENSLQKTQMTTTSESERDAEEKNKNTREAQEAIKPSVRNDMSSALGKVSSAVGSWGLRHSSGTYGAKADGDKRVQDQVIEKKFVQNAETNSRTSIGSSVNRETENEQSRTPKFVPGGTKVAVEGPSGNFDPGHDAAPHDSSRSTRNWRSADDSKVGSGLKLDMQREIERNVGTDKTSTTRMKVGNSSIQPPKSPLPSNAKLPHSVPTKSSINTENQVTVIKIGDGVSPATYQSKPENDLRYLKQPVEERMGEGGSVKNLQNHIIDERKSTRIVVGFDEHRSGFVEKSGRNASSEFDISQNNIKNVVGIRANKSDSLWEDPFVKNLSGANGGNSDPKSPGAARPGKLLIRPASNHPASKTKTEFLTMTKYNDVKKGEFAPTRRAAAIDDDDECVDGDPLDRGGSLVEDLSDLEQYVFVGGGVSIGRSMLAKTKSGEKVR